MMKKAVIVLCALGLLWTCWQPVLAQEQEKTEDLTAQKVDTSAIRKRGAITYDPAGRRDPFRDLLAGQDTAAAEGEEGIAGMSIDNIVLMGITKVRGKLEAIINGPQGFPHTIKVGDKFSDGFVLSIHESKVVFRKTRERGIPLYKPKDITKEINPEER
jgi:Tfp pilus assembly protein PilP